MKKQSQLGLLLVLCFWSAAQESSSWQFACLPLGTAGGLDEANLSAYLVRARGDQKFICLDAGTLYAGLRQAYAKGAVVQVAPEAGALGPDAFLAQYVAAYFISHAHLDHVAGLLINAPSDASKPIFALPSVLDIMRDHYFNWKVWPNFSNEGVEPRLNKYSLVRLNGGTTCDVPQTLLQVTSFPLSHSKPYESTAFLLASGDHTLAYLGDTGPDAVEGQDRLSQFWEVLAPFIAQGRLRALFIEVSYADPRSDNLLFGHLTPHWLFRELEQLAQHLDGSISSTALHKLPLVITHIKPGSGALVSRQIRELNRAKYNFIFPEQGVPLFF